MNILIYLIKSRYHNPVIIERTQLEPILERLSEPRRFLQVLAGPRQIGKTTLIRQVTEQFPNSTYTTADHPTPSGEVWLTQQWEAARLRCRQSGHWLLILDEIQKIPAWSEIVKRYWDEDTATGLDLRVVLLGSAPLLVQTGLTESLAGRFEVLRLGHWSLAEMQSAFGFTTDEFIFFGGYPGAAPLIHDEERWRSYILDSLIETTISRDILMMTRIDKPALLRQMFGLGCQYSAQILSFQKMLGQLQDAGNTTTLAHYLALTSGVGMLTGLSKFSGHTVRQRASVPKLQVLNPALQTAQSTLTFSEWRNHPELWGRLVESAIGARLAGFVLAQKCELFYWREGIREVDYIVKHGDQLLALEVKSGRTPHHHPGLQAFDNAFGHTRKLLIGQGGIPVDEFLKIPFRHLF